MTSRELVERNLCYNGRPPPLNIQETSADETSDVRIPLLKAAVLRAQRPSLWPHSRLKRTTLLLVLVIPLTLLILAVTAALGAGLGLRRGEVTHPQCSAATYLFDCYPEGGANVTSCRSRGCCWNSSASPSCFYPDGFGYVTNGALSEEIYGRSATLSRKANQPAQYREPVATLRLDVYLETEYRLRVKVHLLVYFGSSFFSLSVRRVPSLANENRHIMQLQVKPLYYVLLTLVCN